MAKKRKRENKYEEKLQINGSFEDAMKALLVNNSNKLDPNFYYMNLTNGSFTLDSNTQYFPEQPYVIGSKDFDKITLIVEGDLPFQIVFKNANGKQNVETIFPPLKNRHSGENSYSKEINIPIAPCLITFQRGDVINPTTYCNVSFELFHSKLI